MLKKSAFALLVCVALPSVAQADPMSPFYGRVDAGIVIPEDVSFSASASQSGVSVNAGGTIERKAGYTVSGAIGHKINPYIAAEVEAGYSKFDYDKVTGNLTATSGGTNYTVAGSANIDGSIQTVTAMANAILTPFGRKPTRFSPYVGLGLGIAYSKDEINSIDTLQVNASENDTNLVANGILGFDYKLNKKTSIGAKYRYLWANSGENGFDDMTAHTITANVTFNF